MKPIIIIEAIAPALIFLFLAFADEHNIIMEDQYITLTYSRNLAEGAGLVFNPGEKVEGFSSPLWVFIMAPAFLLGWNVMVFNRVICIMAALLHFPLMNYLMRRYAPANSPLAIRILPSILLALSFPFLFWMKSGMETMFASLLLLSGTALLVSGRRLSGSLVLGMLSITRPEGIIYMAIPVLILLLENRGTTPRDYMRAILPGMCIFLLYEAFRIIYFHDLVPNSFYAKVSPANINQKILGVQYYLEWAFGRRGMAILAALILLIRRRDTLIQAAPWIAAILLNAAFIMAVGGDYMPHSRFIVPVMASAGILIGLSLLSLCRPEIPGPLKKRRMIVSILILTTALALHPDTGRHLKASWYALARPSDLPVPAPAIKDRWKEMWVTRIGQPNHFVGEWIRDNLPPESTVATAQCGIIPYISRAKTIDIFGLMTPDMAKIPLGQRPELLMSMDIQYILLAFSQEFLIATYIPELFFMKDFTDQYCVKAIMASCNYRQGSFGYVLFERSRDQNTECIHPPRVKTNEEILAWLTDSIKEEELLECWDYSYDIFR
jgi:arabinofuranosyltransferase